MKKSLVCALILCLSLTVFTGCDIFGGGTVKANDGWGEGGIGDTIKTSWFDFTIDSVAFVDEYAGYTPEEGTLLLDSVITMKNTYGEDVPMFDTDFWIEWEEDGNYCLDALDSTMMPREFYLEARQEVSYHLVFEVPEDARNDEFGIGFVEVFEEDYEDQDIEELYGDWFAVFFTME